MTIHYCSKNKLTQSGLGELQNKKLKINHSTFCLEPLKKKKNGFIQSFGGTVNSIWMICYATTHLQQVWKHRLLIYVSTFLTQQILQYSKCVNWNYSWGLY